MMAIVGKTRRNLFSRWRLNNPFRLMTLTVGDAKIHLFLFFTPLSRAFFTSTSPKHGGQSAKNMASIISGEHARMALAGIIRPIIENNEKKTVSTCLVCKILYNFVSKNGEFLARGFVMQRNEHKSYDGAFRCLSVAWHNVPCGRADFRRLFLPLRESQSTVGMLRLMT